jgi:hypothetical protein
MYSSAYKDKELHVLHEKNLQNHAFPWIYHCDITKLHALSYRTQNRKENLHMTW